MDDELKKQLFDKLVSLLKSYEGTLEVRSATDKAYDLYGKKKVTVGKRDYDGLYFASSIIQKNFTGFYFFPIYTHPEEFKDIAPELKKCLKGKSCFHMKKDDPLLFEQIKNILNKGFQLYKEKGLI